MVSPLQQLSSIIIFVITLCFFNMNNNKSPHPNSRPYPLSCSHDLTSGRHVATYQDGSRNGFIWLFRDVSIVFVIRRGATWRISVQICLGYLVN